MQPPQLLHVCMHVELYIFTLQGQDRAARFEDIASLNWSIPKYEKINKRVIDKQVP
jgi:hypothetical protein